jgi:hypothetical protein
MFRRFSIAGVPVCSSRQLLICAATGTLVVLLLQVTLVSLYDPGSLFSSASGGHLAIRPWLLFATLYVTGYLILGSNIKSSRAIKQRGVAYLFQLATPMCIMPLLLSLYAFNYWGSPNHLASGWLLASIPLSVMLANTRLLLVYMDNVLKQRYKLTNKISSRINRLGQADLTKSLVSRFTRKTAFPLSLMVSSIAVWSMVGWYFIRVKSEIKNVVFMPNSIQLPVPVSDPCRFQPVRYGPILLSSCNGERKNELETLVSRLHLTYSKTNSRTRDLLPHYNSIPVVADSANLLGSNYFLFSVIGFGKLSPAFSSEEQALGIINDRLHGMRECLSRSGLVTESLKNDVMALNVRSIRSCALTEVIQFKEFLAAGQTLTSATTTIDGFRLYQSPIVVLLDPEIANESMVAAFSRLFVLWERSGRNLVVPSTRGELARKIILYAYREDLRRGLAVHAQYQRLPVRTKNFIVYSRKTNERI